MEPLRQLVEQRRQIAVRDDRFRNRQQGPVLPIGRQHRGFLLRGPYGRSHAGTLTCRGIRFAAAGINSNA